MGLFSGDFIFVGDIGRPDLLEKSVQIKGSKLARNKCMSPFKILKFTRLCSNLAGHGAGSPCGKALGAIPISTIGYEN